MKILMVALHYHGYTSDIAEELRRAGHLVSLHDIQPRDVAMKTLRVAAPRLWQARLDRHHKAILKSEQDREYDLILFIQVHQMRLETLHRFRTSFPNARMALYNWDSISNHDYLSHAPLFDTVQTFDPIDARHSGFVYLPLFASRQFQSVERNFDNPRSAYFVGNIVNPKRYRAIDDFRAHCAHEGIAFEYFMACTPLVRTWLRKAGIRAKGLSRGAIGPEEFMAMLRNANCVFDFANHDQAGYTMRIFENLCARRKIITNNPRIRDERFYSSDRILVVEAGDYSSVRSFLEMPLQDDTADFPEYHIQAFAKHLVNGTGHDLDRSQSA